MVVLQAVLESSPDAVLVVDAAGTIQRANRHVEDLLGYAPADVEGRSVEDLVPETERDEHAAYRRDYMSDPEPRPMGRELDLFARHRDGHRVPVEISLAPLEHDGEPLVVATIADVSRRRERERELRRQNERLEAFASIVSHDLRNPLNVAAGNLELVRSGDDGGDLDAMARSLDRMGDLIDDLLALAREGEAVQDTETVDLSNVVRECWETVDTHDATLVVDTDRTMQADSGRLRQLLANLIRNSVEHGSTGTQDATRPDDNVEHGGPDVTITVTDLPDGFAIEDDGPGIPEDRRGQVFDRGYTTSADGTGFGLAIVREIVDAHDWTIRATEASTGGARFEITDIEPAATARRAPSVRDE